MIESRTCLLPMITAESRFFIRMHGHYRKQVLPYGGGILDQPHLYTEAMEILAARESVLRAEEVDRLRRQGGARRAYQGDG